MAKHIPYEENHRINNNILEKKCNKHYLYFPEEDPWFPSTLEYFYKNNTSEEGLSPWCKECSKQSSIESRQRNRENWLASCRKSNKKPKKKKQMRECARLQRERGDQARWRENNKDKTRMYSQDRQQNKIHKISKKEWIACKNYFDNCCAYCGLSIEEHYYTRKGITKLGDFHKEHKDHDGSNDLSNCLPSCGSCNDKKWKHHFEEWYTQDNPVFSQERYNKIIKWLSEDYKLYIEDKK